MKPKHIIILSLIIGGLYMLSIQPRGIRNHNPGNIKKTGDEWQGLRDPQGDKTFFQFVSPEYGIRAMTKILKRYFFVYGLESVEDIINRWAPPVENITTAYTSYVSGALGVNPDDTIILDVVTLEMLVMAIIRYENGKQPYSLETIKKGVSLA